jgi:hypothetical protein
VAEQDCRSLTRELQHQVGGLRGAEGEQVREAAPKAEAERAGTELLQPGDPAAPPPAELEAKEVLEPRQDVALDEKG